MMQKRIRKEFRRKKLGVSRKALIFETRLASSPRRGGLGRGFCSSFDIISYQTLFGGIVNLIILRLL
jgi:hypothetical protein